jgi:hypothetical protein
MCTNHIPSAKACQRPECVESAKNKSGKILKLSPENCGFGMTLASCFVQINYAFGRFHIFSLFKGLKINNKNKFKIILATYKSVEIET